MPALLLYNIIISVWNCWDLSSQLFIILPSILVSHVFLEVAIYLLIFCKEFHAPADEHLLMLHCWLLLPVCTIFVDLFFFIVFSDNLVLFSLKFRFQHLAVTHMLDLIFVYNLFYNHVASCSCSPRYGSVIVGAILSKLTAKGDPVKTRRDSSGKRRNRRMSFSFHGGMQVFLNIFFFN